MGIGGASDQYQNVDVTSALRTSVELLVVTRDLCGDSGLKFKPSADKPALVERTVRQISEGSQLPSDHHYANSELPTPSLRPVRSAQDVNVILT